MEKLGIDTTLIVVQIINFGLLMLILKKVLYKPVIKALKEREEKLNDIEISKSKMDKTMAEFEDEKAALLKSVSREKKELESEAKRQAQEERKQIIEKANSEAKEIIKKATSEASKLQDKAIKQIKRDMKTLALDAAQEAIADLLDKDAQKKSISAAAKKLEKLKFDGK
jgi:F-type H+-transporting ATPase subunit b